MRNNRIALFSALSTALAAFWMLVAGAPRATAQALDPTAQPFAAQAPGATPAGVGAAAPAAAPDEPPTEAEKLIDDAIKKVAAVKSASADVAQSVKMLGQDFEVKGRYLKAPGSRVYLRLSVSGLPGSSGTMLQVCNGDVLWDYSKILEAESYRRMSIKPIFERLNSPDLDVALRDQVVSDLGFAGPESLLVGVRRAIKFNQMKEDEWQGKPVYILGGTWRSREGLIGPDQQPARPIGWLPAYIPSVATLTIGKEDGWPYKLDLLGRKSSLVFDQPRRRGPDGRLLGRPNDETSAPPTEIHLVYSNVQFNATIRPEEFAFSAPANANVEDITEIITRSLDARIAQQAMQKRSEAAKKEGAPDDSTLGQPLEIPSPAAPSTPVAPKGE